MMKNASNWLALFAIYYFLMPAPAYGYFDLGTGTYMLQMLLGFGAAVWLSMRTSWIRLGRGKTPAKDKASGESPAANKIEESKDESAAGPGETAQNGG